MDIILFSMMPCQYCTRKTVGEAIFSVAMYKSVRQGYRCSQNRIAWHSAGVRIDALDLKAADDPCSLTLEPMTKELMTHSVRMTWNLIKRCNPLMARFPSTSDPR